MCDILLQKGVQFFPNIMSFLFIMISINFLHMEIRCISLFLPNSAEESS